MQDKNEIPSDRECPEVKGWLRYILIIIGTICVGLAYAGDVSPRPAHHPFRCWQPPVISGVQTILLLLINNRFCGKYIQNYRQKKGIPLKLKISVISLLC